ncbi:hypothetical protein AAF712_000227 [Marasmius tenuissimus]|uniref:Uncharacterized protein n=1 Tax=Marasmius tenuissimus TaxID=585030 RepID=A0ABR3AGB1_9AGAR
MGRSSHYSISCFYLVILFLLISATGCVCQSESVPPNDLDISSQITFTGDIDQWSLAIDKLAQESGIPDNKKTELAINVGLDGTPEIQSVMKARHGNFTLLSGGQVWEYTAFLDDLESCSWYLIFFVSILQYTDIRVPCVFPIIILLRPAEAQRLKGNGELTQDLTKPGELFKALEGGVNDIKSLLSGVQLPQVDIQLPKLGFKPPKIDLKLPSIDLKLPPIDLGLLHIDLGLLPPGFDLEALLRALKPALDSLERVFLDAKASVQEFMKTVHDFIQAQLKNLPGEIQNAITEFRDFTEEHPYIVAAAGVALVVVTTHVILPHVFLWVLEMLGFGPLGPVAGSWAAAMQSVIYGGNTGGVFSVLQSVAMTAKSVWPVAVFMDVAALVASAIVFLAPSVIKSIVNEHLAPFPLATSQVVDSVADLGLSTPILLNQVVGDELEQWMVAMGNKMTELNVPHVQWLDVAIEAMRKRCEELAGL